MRSTAAEAQVPTRKAAISETRMPQQQERRKTTRFMRTLAEREARLFRSVSTVASSRRVRIFTASTVQVELCISVVLGF
jgi:hypothetical protein